MLSSAFLSLQGHLQKADRIPDGTLVIFMECLKAFIRPYARHEQQNTIFACGHADAQPGEQPAVLLLVLARTCIFMHSTALPHVMETLAGSFPGQGGFSGSGQPPAFVAGQVGK